MFKEEQEKNADNKAEALKVGMYENIVDSQQLEIEDQAMKIRKKDTQILLINQKLIDKAAESKSAMKKKNSEIISLKNMLDMWRLGTSRSSGLDRQQSEILKQGEQWAKEILLAPLKVSKKVETKRETETRPGFETGHAQSEHAKKPLSESDPVKLATFKDVNYVWGKILAKNGLEGIGKFGQPKFQVTKLG